MNNLNKTILEAMKRLKMNKNVYSVTMDGREGMTKHEQNLRQNASDLKEAAQSLIDEGKQEDAKNKLEEAKAAKKELDDFLALKKDFQGLGDLPELDNKGGMGTPEPSPEPKAEYKQAFFNAIRGKKLSEDEMAKMQEFKAKLSEGSGEDGGYVVPEDIQTEINELKNTVDAMEQYVRVEPVSTNKGARTLEKRADSTPFESLSEYDEMDELDGPQFDRVSFEIDDYAGFLPIPNDLLNDTDQSLENYLRNWFAKKSKATRNKLILDVLDDLDKEDFEDHEDIKKALNVDLDPAISQNAKVFTNQDGFNFLDNLEDDNDRPLLQPDPTDATKRLFAGKEVVVLSNKTIESDDDKAPVIVGDLQEAIVLFDRKQSSVDITDIGGKAWRTNTSEMRAIEREDVKKWDDEAVVYGKIDISGGSDSGE